MPAKKTKIATPPTRRSSRIQAALAGASDSKLTSTTASAPSKPKRGRPSKKRKAQEATGGTSGISAPTTVPKKRGRPPKIPQTQHRDSAGTTATDAIPKRKPGRPRKNPDASKRIEDSVDDDDRTVTVEVGARNRPVTFNFEVRGHPSNFKICYSY